MKSFRLFRLSGVLSALTFLCAVMLASQSWAAADGYAATDLDLKQLSAVVWMDPIAVEPDHGDEAVPDAAALPAPSIQLPSIEGGMVRQSAGSSPIPHTAAMARRLMPGGASAPGGG